jgi:Peptidase family S41
MKYPFLLLITLIIYNNAYNQNCDCLTNFKFVIAKLKANYIGYNDKIKKYYPKGIDSVTRKLLQHSKTEKNEYECLSLINKWLQLFNDEHVRIGINNDSTQPADIHRIFSTAEKTIITEKDFYNYLNKKILPSDSLTGIWEDQQKNYTVGVMPDPDRKNSIIGFILETKNSLWEKSQVKFRIKKQNKGYTMDYFYSRNHFKILPYFSFNNQSMNFGRYGTWEKIQTDFKKTTYTADHDFSAASFRVIDNKNCVFTIPICNTENIAKMDSLVSANKSILQSTEHLVLDLRNNTGGTVLVFEKLFPYIYTNPIITSGSSVLASEDNVKSYFQFDFPGISDSMKTVFLKEANLLKAHAGEVYELWHDDTLILKETLPYPQKISILINEACASSTEIFLLSAVQSKKVTLFGQHTSGAVDYTDGLTINLPCKFMELTYSSSRTNRFPEVQIDNIGIQANVKIPGNIKDWIKFTINLYAKKKSE